MVIMSGKCDRSRYTLLAIVFLLSGLCNGMAQEATSTAGVSGAVPETLEQLTRILLPNNPDISAAREKALAAKERIAVEKSWADPMLGFMVMPDPTPDMEMLSGARNTVISQMIPLGGQKRLAGRMARSRLQMERAGLSSEILAQIEGLKITFEEISYLDDAIGIIRENRNTLDQIAAIAIASESPPALLSEIQRIQTQLAQIGYDEALLQELRTAEQARINSLLNRSIGRPFVPAGDGLAVEPPPASLSLLLGAGGVDQPQIKMAQAAARMASQEVSMARKERTPDLTFGWSQQRNRDWRRDDRGDTIILDFNMPIWNGKNRGRIQEAAHKRAEAGARLQAERNRLASDICAQFVRIQNLWRTIRIYEDTLLPQAAHALEVAQTVSRRQEAQLPEALESQAVWLNFKLAHRRALADYRQGLARLDTLTGRALPAEEAKP